MILKRHRARSGDLLLLLGPRRLLLQLILIGIGEAATGSAFRSQLLDRLKVKVRLDRVVCQALINIICDRDLIQVRGRCQG